MWKMGRQLWRVVVVTHLMVSLCPRETLSRTTCSIDLNSEYRASEEPLFLSPDGARIVYPNNRASIEIRGGTRLRVYCGHKNFKELKTRSNDSILVQCNSGKFFTLLSPLVAEYSGVDSAPTSDLLGSSRSYYSAPYRRPVHFGASVQPKSFACSSVVRSAIRPGKPCGLKNREEHHQEFSIGFPISNGFLPIISVCFNSELKSVLWSKHIVTPVVEYHMSKVPRIRFIQDRIPYGDSHLNVEQLYSRQQQLETIAAILGSKDIARKYIEPKGNGFFARGHLAPKGDFVYAGEQLATFHFINVAPQWQYFNGGQWEKIESTLRNYVMKNRVEASVLTLSLGITQLEDEQGEDRDIYLYYNQRTQDKLIKVPKLYAKIINFGNSSASSKSVVIVGVNQPYESHVKMSTNDIICPDVCDRYEWISDVSRNNDQHHSSGYIYCCTPADFISYLQSGQGYKLDSTAVQESSDSNEDGSEFNKRAGSHRNRIGSDENSASEDRFGLDKNANLNKYTVKKHSDSNNQINMDGIARLNTHFALNENAADSSSQFGLNENAGLNKYAFNKNADSSSQFGLNEKLDVYSGEYFESSKTADTKGDNASLNRFSNGGDVQDADYAEATNTLIGQLSDFLGSNP